jgi:signal transduction histidine kinase
VRRSDLNTTVEHAVMLGRQQAQARAIQIALYKDSSLPEVEHDSDQIHQLLLNLLLNALQAIDVQSNASQGSVGQGNVVQSNDSHPDHAKGKITVTVKGLGNAALIEVADNGRGIPSDQLPSIFRPFYTTKGEGTGLGLSLARRIVEDHQGRIDVASAVGQGTTFAVVLPLQRAAVPVSGS